MAYDPDNIFAKILRGDIPCEKVFEDEHSLAFKDLNPQAPIHVLVIPKGAYVSMDDFTASATDAEIAGFTRAVAEVARHLGAVPSGYRLIANHGRDADQTVDHLHVHILAGAALGPLVVGKRR
jgi:diadenosine tetraphosphate (Ap4A) HIT family hydrolase